MREELLTNWAAIMTEESPERSAALTPPSQLVVLFVHGIGAQAQGEMLTEWGDALVSWIDGWRD